MVPIETAQLLLDTLRIPTDDSEQADLRSRWEAADHRGVAELMQREGGELWLHRRLKQIGVPDTSVANGPFWNRLERLAKKSVAQNLLVTTHAEQATNHLTRAGIPHVPIKGLARLRSATEVPVFQLSRYE